METLTIGQAAKRAQVGVETIRFYERRGLIEKPSQPSNGFRQYPPETVRRILFIRRAKDLGFTLKEIEELLSLRVDSMSPCDDVRKRAEFKIADIEEKIATLRDMKTALQQLTATCLAQGTTTSCPILDVLDLEEPL